MQLGWKDAHPNSARACAVATSGFSGAQLTNAAMRAVRAQPAAVMLCSIFTPFDTVSTLQPSVTCTGNGILGLQRAVSSP